MPPEGRVGLITELVRRWQPRSRTHYPAIQRLNNHALRQLDVKRALSLKKSAKLALSDAACQLSTRCAQESYTADSYTQEGLDHIHATNFKSLVLRHYPELKARTPRAAIPIIAALSLASCWTEHAVPQLGNYRSIAGKQRSLVDSA